jgi:hypothetical protein
MAFLDRLKWLFTGKGEAPTSIKNEGEGTNGSEQPKHNSVFDSESDLNESEFVSTLMNHPIFTELREWEEYRTKILDIDDPVKRNMAKYYLGLFFKEFRKAVETSVKEHQKYLDDTIALNNLIIETINDVRQTALGSGVPEVFLDKFTNYLYTQTKILDSTCKDLDRFEYYNNPLARATFRLDLEFMAIRNITSEVESIINNMNGELHAALMGSVFDE